VLQYVFSYVLNDLHRLGISDFAFGFSSSVWLPAINGAITLFCASPAFLFVLSMSFPYSGLDICIVSNVLSGWVSLTHMRLTRTIANTKYTCTMSNKG
jgi:hypothetical protein